MAELIAVAYPDEHRAAEVLAALRRLQSEYLIEFTDAVYVTKNAEGKYKLHQSVNLPIIGAVSGGFWGMLIGLLFLNPLLGAAIGAGAGALSGSLTDYGINDDFVKQLAQEMKASSSALFVLITRVTPDRVIPEVRKFGGTVLHSSLSKEAEARFQHALREQGQSEPPKETPALLKPEPSSEATSK